VVLWTDPGGYDAYRVERRFSPPDQSAWSAIEGAIGSPNRYSLRRAGLDDETLERVRGGGWTLEDLQKSIDQFVVHYDVSGTSRQCFKILHDRRGLSVHFLLDIDGTIYQTLDVKERAWHATKANDRSVGIEIAHIGAYERVGGTPLESWYARDTFGFRINLPEWMGDGGVRTPGFVGRPASPRFAEGEINGRSLVQPDFTPEQYESLIRLTAALCTVLPGIECDYPRDETGAPLAGVMSDDAFDAYSGVLGHQHVQGNKIDPGPAFDWERVIGGARRIMERNR
jgi:N-acetylmuramoyl-L-alanine amidase